MYRAKKNTSGEILAQCFHKGVSVLFQPIWIERIVDKGTTPLAPNKPCLPQDAQVLRDRRLRDA
jgi:hypothetical protein